MKRMSRWLPLAGLTLLAGAFAFLNRGETAVLRLGLFTLWRVPVALLVFAAFLLGMGAMLLFGLRQDLRVRRLLREHGLLGGATAFPGRPPAREEERMHAGREARES